MNKSDDSIRLAEKRLAEAKATALAEYRAVERNVRRRTSSPLLIAGALIASLAIGYFGVRRLGKPKRPARAVGSGLWPQVLEAAQLLLPLLGALKAAGEAKAARKTVARATGATEVEPREKPKRPQ
jgi:hypothetical protein